MRKKLEFPFTKFHGLGNDFIIARGRDLPRSLPALARSITNRHRGVGADGFLVVLPPRNRRHDARVRFFNADGSEPEVSGNGLRCVGAYLAAVKPSRRRWEIETLAGVKSLTLIGAETGRWIFEVSMGVPILSPAEIPFRAGDFSTPVVNFPLRTAREEVPRHRNFDGQSSLHGLRPRLRFPRLALAGARNRSSRTLPESDQRGVCESHFSG